MSRTELRLKKKTQGWMKIAIACTRLWTGVLWTHAEDDVDATSVD